MWARAEETACGAEAEPGRRGPGGGLGRKAVDPGHGGSSEPGRGRRDRGLQWSQGAGDGGGRDGVVDSSKATGRGATQYNEETERLDLQ